MHRNDEVDRIARCLRIARWSRSLRVFGVTALSALLLALPIAARADDDDGHEKEPDPFPLREVSPALLSTAWTVVPVGAGLALGVKHSGGARTAVSGTLVWGGAIAGPAAGYWHGGAGKHAIRGLLFRGATFALASAIAPTDDWRGGTYPDIDHAGSYKSIVWIAASGLILVSDIVAIAHAERSVRDVEAHRATAVIPWVDPGRRSYGLVVSTGF
jgi:hypothetical protein